MGRSIPSSRATLPPPPLPLLAAAVAASVAILFTLCISHHRSKSATPKSQPLSPLTATPLSSSSSDSIKKPNQMINKKLLVSPPPPPPPEEEPAAPSSVQVQVSPSIEQKVQEEEDAATHGPIAPTGPSLLSSPPRRTLSGRLSVSLSMRFPDRLSRIRTSRKEKKQKASQTQSAAAAAEESIWRKTIILGERCRVPNSDDEDELVVYDDKGNRQRNYHPKTPRSLPVSRTNSFAAADCRGGS